jgi:hypothetical protein
MTSTCQAPVKRHLIVGTDVNTEQDVILFTWTRDPATGIRRAEHENIQHGGQYFAIRAIELK